MTTGIKTQSPYDAKERLVDLASAVSDRQSVDWESAEDLGPGVAGLRTLARLAAAFDAESATAEHASEAGEPLFRWGHLEALELIGEGRFGQVYRSRDVQLGRDVALKLARDELPRGALAEARRLARVRHRSVLTVHGAAVHDGRAGIWTDLLGGQLGGQTLEDRLDRDGVFGEGELRLAGTEVCGALAAVHGAGLVHGDVKTSNVVRDRDGQLVLVDFGAARLAEGGAATIVQGTPSYLAPEVARGDASPTAGSDLYALGALLYRLATGEFWRGPGGRPLRDARPDLSPDLVRAVDLLLADRPQDRPASAGAAERLLRGGGETAPRRSVWVGLAALTLVALAASVVWAFRDRMIGDPSSRPATVATSAERAVLWGDRGGTTFRVEPGATLRPGDRLSLRVDLSAETHVYVFNEDDAGQLFVLFPLPGTGPENPLPAGPHRLPTAEQSWQVTSAGGQERFLIVGSVGPRPDLERFGDQHEVASSERRVRASAAEIGRTETGKAETLRGVGGLTAEAGSVGESELERLYESLRPDASLSGPVWVRLLEVENPRP